MDFWKRGDTSGRNWLDTWLTFNHSVHTPPLRPHGRSELLIRLRRLHVNRWHALRSGVLPQLRLRRTVDRRSIHWKNLPRHFKRGHA